MIKFTSKKSGITLIALIITIIVMLILVAIVLNMSINGRLFNYAGKATLDTEMAKEKEYITLAYSEANMKKQVDEDIIFRDYFEDALIRHSGGRDVLVSDDEYGYLVEFRDVNRFYTVGDNGESDEVIAVSDETPGELEGAGTQNDPYKIQSIEDLVVLSIMVSGGNQGLGIEENDFIGEYVLLETSLNFKSKLSYCDPDTTQYDTYLGGDGTTKLINELTTGNGFRSIGGFDETQAEKPFKGTFLGNNNDLKNIYISDKYDRFDGIEMISVDCRIYGLFGYINSATISNLNVTGTVESDCIFGGIVGEAIDSTITHCTSGVNVIRNGYVFGGILGYAPAGTTISNCNFNGNINISGSVGSHTGGIVGYMDTSTVSGCSNSGTIKTRNSSIGGNVGGIISYIESGSVTDCICRATIDVGNAKRCAGIIGYANAKTNAVTVTRCSNESNINATNDPAGSTNNLYTVGGILGVAGYKSNLTTCTNTGNINTSNIVYVGGIAGYYKAENFTDSRFIDVHNKGTITCEKNVLDVGGIVGEKEYGLIDNASNEGAISAKSNWNVSLRIGGIAGYSHTQGWICNCYNTAALEGATMYNADVGGIVGYTIYGFIGYCYNRGNLSGIGGGKTNIGGIASCERAGQIYGCYNTGEIRTLNDYTGQEIHLGGIAGYCYYTIKSMNAYNFGNIINPPAIASVGGAYGGRIVNGSAPILDFYYENHTWTGTSADDGVATRVENINKSQMIADIADAREDLGALAYTDLEPDFSTWVIDENVNDGYPILSWQVQS